MWHTVSVPSYSKKLCHAENYIVENTFIAAPFLIVLLIAIPSFSLNYSQPQGLVKGNTSIIQVVGHQWFWEVSSYTSPKLLLHKALAFSDSGTHVIIAAKQAIYFENSTLTEAGSGLLRLTNMDRAIEGLSGEATKFNLSSYDVIHSFWLVAYGFSA